MIQTQHTPEACSISDATIDALKTAMANASPDKRTGAAFVNIDTRVLAALIAPVRNTAPELLDAAQDAANELQCEIDEDPEYAQGIRILAKLKAAIAKAEGRP